MSAKQKTLKPPEHLSPEAAAWWKSVVDGYVLAPHHVLILARAAEALDRCGAAREAIDKHGLTYKDRFGAPRVRPEVAIERDSRLAFLRAVRELRLDDPPDEFTRPPRIGGK